MAVEPRLVLVLAHLSTTAANHRRIVDLSYSWLILCIVSWYLACMSFILGRSSSPALARPRGYHITYLSMAMVDQFLSPYTRYSRCRSLPSVHCLYSPHHPLHGRQLVFPSSHWVPEFNYLNTMVGPLPQSHQQIDGSFRCLGAVHDILRSCSDQGDQADQVLDELPSASLSSAITNVTPFVCRCRRSPSSWSTL